MKKRYLLVVCSLIISILFFISNMKWIDKPISNTKEEFFPVVDIYNKQFITQKIMIKNENLKSFSLYFGNYENEFTNEEVVVKLFDNKEEIYSNTLLAKDLKNNEEKYFELEEKIENSKNKEYTIEVSCSECDTNHKMALYGIKSTDNTYPLSINDNEHVNYTLRLVTVGKTFDYGKLIFFIILNLIFIGIASYDFLKNRKAILSNKVSVILEFCVSLASVFSLYKVIYISNYFNKLSIIYLIFLLITLLLLSVIIIYRFIHYKKTEDLFLSLMIPIGLLYLVFVIPNQVADENGHYNSAFNIQNGDLLNIKHSTEILSFVDENGRYELTSYFRLNKVLNEKANYNDTEMFCTTGYSPIFYVPASIGIFIGRVLNIPIFWGYYLARLLTFITYLFLIYMAIKIIPFGKSLLFIYMFNPMAIHQSISVSADVLLNAFSILYISNVLNLLHKEKINMKDIGFLALGNITIALSKYVYLPLTLLSLLLLTKKNNSSREKKLIISSFIFSFLLCLGLFCYANFINAAPPVDHIVENNVSFSNQLKFLLSNPNNILLMFSKTIESKGDFYFLTFLGQSLSWLSLPISYTIVIAYFGALLLSIFAFKDKDEPNKLEKISLSVISISIMILIILGMNLTWTSVGTYVTEGVQGRYFYPVLIALLLALIKKNRDIKIKNVYLKFSFILVIINLLTVTEIIYYFI